MLAGLVRIPVTSREKKRPINEVNLWEQLGLGDFVALEATTAASELINAVLPPIREHLLAPVASSISQSIGKLNVITPNGEPEISRDEGRTWDPLPGATEI
jgi:hypothetical protein